ncbi:MAG TPA: hypothetical protein VIL85_28140 [Thermomicrobiales bacterium]|jgi:hypothetical protein
MADSHTRKELHFSIGTGPTGALSPDTAYSINSDHDLRLVKAALLYADSATLYSMTTSWQMSLLQVKNLTLQEKIAFVKLMMPTISSDDEEYGSLRQLLRRYDQIMRRPQPNREERQVIKNTEAVVHLTIPRIEAELERLRPAEIMRAVESGFLRVHDFVSSYSDDKARLAAEMIRQGAPDEQARGSRAWTDAMAEQYYQIISNTLSDNSTYPLFDEEAGGLIGAALREGALKVSDAGLVRGKHSGLAADILERLPQFEYATVSDILDIRKELEQPLRRFRRAVLGFSEKIKNAPWDEDFVTEADGIFYRDIDPVITEIEEQVRTNSYLATLLRRIGIPSATALTAVLAGLSDVPGRIAQALNNPAVGSAAIPAAAVGTVPAVLTAINAAVEHRTKMGEIKRHDLFFYYKSKQQLQSKVRPSR